MKSFFNAIISAFRNIANFRGRANRREFWFWILFVVVVYLLVRYLELDVLTPMAGYLPYEEVPGYLSWPSWGWLIFCVLPTASLIVRRVHDHDRPGWMALTIIPLVWWLVGKGTKGPNRYG